MNPEIEVFPPVEISTEEEKRTPEQPGLKELCSNIEIVFAKRGGREPGVHQWGR